MDSFEKKQIVLQLFEYMDDYYLMYPEEKDSHSYPRWGKLDSYNEAHPEIFGKLARGEDKILKGLANATYMFYVSNIID